MTIKYSLEKNDYLEYYLFYISKKKSIIEIRKKNRNSLFLLYLLLVFIFLLAHYYIASIIVIIVGIVFYFYYPKYIKKKYRERYEVAIDEELKNNFGKPLSLTFCEDFIEDINEISETKYWHKGLEEINEISDYYFIKLLSGGSLILPKRFIPDHLEFQSYISNLAEKLNISYNRELK